MEALVIPMKRDFLRLKEYSMKSKATILRLTLMMPMISSLTRTQILMMMALNMTRSSLIQAQMTPCFIPTPTILSLTLVMILRPKKFKVSVYFARSSAIICTHTSSAVEERLAPYTNEVRLNSQVTEDGRSLTERRNANFSIDPILHRLVNKLADLFDTCSRT